MKWSFMTSRERHRGSRITRCSPIIGAIENEQRGASPVLFTDIDILDENFDYQAHQWVGVKDSTIVSQHN